MNANFSNSTKGLRTTNIIHAKLSIAQKEEATKDVLLTKTVLKNFAIFTGKHLCWSLFLLKLLYKILHYI